MTGDSEKFELKMDYWALVANTSKHKQEVILCLI
jgi:hypothetical protein